MSRVAIIGVGQSEFVRAYPGSVRELAFEGFKDAMRDARLTAKDIHASVICTGIIGIIWSQTGACARRA